MAFRSKKVITPATPLGWREWVGFPELGIPAIKCKVDTGARTSAIHAYDVETFYADGVHMARFAVHPVQRQDDNIVICQAPIVDRRHVRNSGGQSQRRIVIRTPVQIGPDRFEIEITLTRRDSMGFRALLGRTAVRGRYMIDPARSFMRGPRPRARIVTKNT